MHQGSTVTYVILFFLLKLILHVILDKLENISN